VSEAQARNGDPTEALQHVRSAWSRANLALRRIEKIERSLLEKRIDVTDQVMDRLAEDKQLISRINRLVASGTPEGFNEAADRINEVIKGWRELIQP
jgi:hypothetical protein